MEPPQDISEGTMAFALRAVRLYRYRHLGQQERAARRLADQFLRAAASIGANIEEARGGESRRDFVHKYGIALKEARETLHWLKPFREVGFVEVERLDPLLDEADQPVALLTLVVTRTRRNGTP